MWYKRSTYRILNNIVSNLRQTGYARTLLTNWRSMTADKNEEAASAPIDQPDRKERNADNFVFEDEGNEDDIAVLRHLIRNRFGVDENLTFRQQQN